MTTKIMKYAKVLYDFHSQQLVASKADFILAMGSHDLRVAKRAAELYNLEKADFIVCTGGYGKVTRNIWNSTEAEKFAEVCIDDGVPASKIILETNASNSGDNFLLTKDILSNHKKIVRTGIIVCKPYMSKRALATGQKQWPEVEWFVMAPEISFEDYPNHEVPLDRMINLMVGDLQRLTVYADKGFQEYVDIPGYVTSAYEQLRRLGYDEFVLTNDS